MKDEKERRKHLFVVIAIVGGGGAVLFVLANASGARGSPSTRAPARSTARGVAVQPHSLNFGPNPAQPQLDAAILAARESALATFDQSSVAERSVNAQYALGLNQDATARAISANNNATQLKETGIATNAYETVAEAQARTQLAETQAATSAYQSVQSGAQSTSLWQSIISGIVGFLPFLGSSGIFGSGTANPITYGTGPVQYAAPDPLPAPPPGFG
jgi:hypothetical protein